MKKNLTLYKEFHPISGNSPLKNLVFWDLKKSSTCCVLQYVKDMFFEEEFLI